MSSPKHTPPTRVSAADELNRVAKALRERLDKHNEGRKEVQDKLHKTCEEYRKRVTDIEIKTSEDLEKQFTEEDNRIQSILSDLRTAKDDEISKELQKAKAVLSVAQTYELNEEGRTMIKNPWHYGWNPDKFMEYEENPSYHYYSIIPELITKKKTEVQTKTETDVESITEALIRRLDEHDENRRTVLERLQEICRGYSKQIDDLEGKINDEIKKEFKKEDDRYQSALVYTQNAMPLSKLKEDDAFDAALRAEAELIVIQRYDLKETKIDPDKYSCGERHLISIDFCVILELVTKKEVVPKQLDKLSGLKVTKTSNKGKVHLSFNKNLEQERVLKENGLEIAYATLLQKKRRTRRRQQDVWHHKRGHKRENFLFSI